MRRAFTLVEMLVVIAIIAIIAILAALLFSTLANARNTAYHSTCGENLHQLGLADTLYANDHDGWVPPATTDEALYTGRPNIDPAELKASPAVLRNALDPYVKSDLPWFCPADHHAREDVLWLGMRHRLTSYSFYPFMPGQLRPWPPRMQLSRDPAADKPANSEDVPLISDAVGIPRIDSDPALSNDDQKARSNHPDDMVNAIRHDLSLVRKPAKYWMGTQE